MCGITFIYSQKTSEKDIYQNIFRANISLAHRGPDQQNIVKFQNGCVGHARLSIIDIESSAQPMICPQKKYYLTFNGEIYNYLELKKTLKPKWNFKTSGDTEVLLAGLITEGPEFMKKMNGMWAFALWNDVAKHLLIGRDPLGKKPLYYTADKLQIVCASEIPSLKIIDPSSHIEDPKGTTNYFKYGFFLPGKTIYKNIFELLPGHYAQWQPQKEICTRQYWSIAPNLLLTKEKDDIGKSIRELMIKSVEKRLVADVEIGAFLSGGIDSSLIVALAKKSVPHLKTFTIGFKNTSYDESVFAAISARKNNTEHYLTQFDEISFTELEHIQKKSLGQPFADMSLLPYHLLAQSAAKHVKVVLSGDGADEIFSGYQRYQAKVLLNWFIRLPVKLRNNIEKVLSSIPEPMVHHSRSIIKKAKLFMDIANSHENEQKYIAPYIFPPETFKKIFADLELSGHEDTYTQVEPTSLGDIHQMMYQDMLVYLPQDILQKVDRSSMANSLEVRSPFLDLDLATYAFSMPQKEHRSLFSGKKLLRKHFKAEVPLEIWKRRKQGFSIPAQEWFKNELGHYILELNKKHSTPIDQHALSHLLSTHRTGIRDYSIQLWAIYSYLTWKNSEI